MSVVQVRLSAVASGEWICLIHCVSSNYTLVSNIALPYWHTGHTESIIPANLIIQIIPCHCFIPQSVEHTYPCKPLRKIKVTICNHQADSQLYVCGLISDLVNWKFRKSMVIHDTECPYWDQVSLNNANQTKPNPVHWTCEIQLVCVVHLWAHQHIARKAKKMRKRVRKKGTGLSTVCLHWNIKVSKVNISAIIYMDCFIGISSPKVKGLQHLRNLQNLQHHRQRTPTVCMYVNLYFVGLGYEQECTVERLTTGVSHTITAMHSLFVFLCCS